MSEACGRTERGGNVRDVSELVVCCVGGSPAALEAIRQADRLAPADATFVLVTVFDSAVESAWLFGAHFGGMLERAGRGLA